MTGDPLSILVQPNRESKRIIDQFVVLISTTQQARESLTVNHHIALKRVHNVSGRR